MSKPLSKEELEAAHCWWDAADRVPGRPEMTEFRRKLRYHQAQWREANGHPIGTQPIAPKPGEEPKRLVGNHLPLDYARETGANFITKQALEAARARTSFIEPHQSFDHQRLWADLLWAPSMSFNLFGDLAADLGLADRAVHAWWPDAPGTVVAVRFTHSPGRFDPLYLDNLMDLDTAFILDLGGGKQGIIGVSVKYHQRIKPEEPKPIRAQKYGDIAKRSAMFRRGAIDTVNSRHDLFELWLQHLLVLSMLQHPSGEWAWGRFALVHPAASPDFVDGCARYRDLLADQSTFSSVTVEELLDSGQLPRSTTAALRKRYIVR